MTRLKNLLAQKFEIKDLGKLHYFGGLRLLDQKMNLYFSKEVYSNLLKESGLTSCKLAESPVESNQKLQMGVEGSVHIHKRLFGRLIYLSSTRPGIAFQ